MTHSERVILIKGDSTKWYNQAIFIVNKDTPATKMPVDFVAEAERIIYNHVTGKKGVAAPGVYTSASAPKFVPPANYNTPASRSATKNSKLDFTLNLMMILACIAIAAVFTYGIMS
ncbi:MAG: hypothetical protein LBI27_01435 [Clostridiales bacterium]|jgi:hypothetical protein|nr:hypothetical protein [Clostridiales bacterium]